MSTYAIEQGIPLPGPKKDIHTPSYPFMAMSIGDSFLVPCLSADKKEVQDQICKQAWKLKDETGKRFATRHVTQGIRVWRTD